MERYKSQSSIPSRRANLSSSRKLNQNAKNDKVVDREDLHIVEQPQLMIVEPKRINNGDLQQRHLMAVCIASSSPFKYLLHNLALLAPREWEWDGDMILICKYILSLACWLILLSFCETLNKRVRVKYSRVSLEANETSNKKRPHGRTGEWLKISEWKCIELWSKQHLRNVE